MNTVRQIAGVSIILGLLVSSHTGFAVTWQGDDGTSPNDWQTAANWDSDPNVPGVGGQVGEDVTFNAADSDTIDINGASVDVGAFTIYRTLQTFTNSGAAATITCTSLTMGANNGNDVNHKFYPDVDLNGTFIQPLKTGNLYFYGSLEVDTLDGHLGGFIEAHGPFTINDPDPITVRHTTAGTYMYSGQTYSLYDVLNCNAGMTLSCSYVERAARVNAYAANSLGGITGPLNLSTNSMLCLYAAQTTFPSGDIEIGPYALLGGDTGTATWGPGNNINVLTDAILAISAGTEPTIGDIGADVAWKPHTSVTTTTAGAIGTTIYKGISIGNFGYPSVLAMSGSTLVAPAGAGDVEVLVLSGINGNANNYFSIESLDQTGVANFHCRGSLISKGIRINATPNANSCTTFNFIGESGDTKTAIANFYSGDWNVYSSQVYNFSGAGAVFGEVDNIEGQLTFSDEITFDPQESQSKTITRYDGTKLTFNDGSALLINTDDSNLLESLDADQVVVNGTPSLVLASYAGAYNITAAAHTNLYNFMTQSHVCICENNNNIQYLQGDGIVLGDGRYLLSANTKGTKYLYSDAGHDAKISGVGGAGTSMGIAVQSGYGLSLYIPIDGNGADLKLNNVTEMTLMGGNLGGYWEGRRAPQVPKGTITLNGPIANVPAIYFAGTVNVNTNVTVAKIGGVDTVQNATNLTYQTVAPGFTNGCGNLNLGRFDMPAGGTYEWSLADTNAAAGTGYDQIDGTTVTFGGAWTVSLDVADFTGTLDGSEVFTIIDGTSISDIGTPTVTAPGTGYRVGDASVYLENNDVKLTGVKSPPAGMVFILK
jgi:hypothetical protein